MAIEYRRIDALRLHVLESERDASEGRHTAFQMSTLAALVDRQWDADLTVGELRQHGTLGLGTFNALDGEMIVVDGDVYRAHADGDVTPVGDEECTPLAAVVPFETDTMVFASARLDHATLTRTIFEVIQGGPDIAYAIRFDGTLDQVHARSVPPQSHPYPSLAEVASTQQHRFTIGPVEGTLVGFVFPTGVDGIQQPGVHMHAITEDRRRGGHVIEARVGPGVLRIQALDSVELLLPDGVELPDPASYARDDADLLRNLARGRGR